jgi:hypothetical protein
MTQVSKINGIPVVDTYTTGSTVNNNEVSLTNNLGDDILKLSGGTNIELIDNGGNSVTLNSNVTGGGASVSFPWKFKDPTVSGDPGNGQFRFNSSVASAITEIYVSDFTNNSIDASNILSALTSGNKLYIQQNDDANRAVLFNITASTTDNTGWFTIPVEYLQGTTLPKKDKTCGWILVGGSGGGGSFNNFIISDGSNTQTIDDGDTLLFSTNSGLTATVSATDNVTFDYNLTGMTAEATPASGDKLLLWDNVSKAHKNIDWDDLPGAGGGEVNTASNLGGANNVFAQKNGVDFEFRTLSAGTNVTITSGATTLTINASGGGGGSSRITGSTQTTNATPTEVDKIDTLTDNATNIVEVYVKAYESAAAEYGVWKRTLTVTSVSGTVVIREENADVDKTSSGLNANSINFTVNGSDIDIDVTGIAATTIDWESAYEIIL